MGVTVLGFTEREVWKMTPYKIQTLYSIHREYTDPNYTAPAEKDEEADLEANAAAIRRFFGNV